ncbi:MAG: amidohydrolase family protein [Candidatus Latescibacteria bacterium]|nr:amidohydrolase family protein [Candidatus Latescibacterota bacterium]
MTTSQTDGTAGLWQPQDREFFDRELASFVPDRVFDAHTHLWRKDFIGWQIPGAPADIGYTEYRQLMEDLHPGRRAGALFIPAVQPSDGSFAAQNEWVATSAAADPACRGLFFVRPGDDPEWVRQEVRRLGLHGLKCYHTMAAVEPTWEARIPDYLPEELVRLAHEEGWVITLHMVRSRAAADAGNIHWIRHYCQTYPQMRLILAHSARGFQAAHNMEGVPQLTGLDNLYFDTSANCQPIAHQAIIRYLGHERLMYGTDLPVCHGRGMQVGVADAFIWLDEETPVWDAKHLPVKPVLIGLEHLRSIKWACWSERLGDGAVEDIFWNNAARLFGVA